MSEKKLQIKVTLQSEAAVKFLKIKKHLGMQTNSETIRHLISQYYDRMEARNE